MKSKIVKELKDAEIKFPLIAKNLEKISIVLFSSEFEGTELYDPIYIGIRRTNYNSCLNAKRWQILDSITITFES